MQISIINNQTKFNPVNNDPVGTMYICPNTNSLLTKVHSSQNGNGEYLEIFTDGSYRKLRENESYWSR